MKVLPAMKPHILVALLVCSLLAPPGMGQSQPARQVDLYPATFTLPPGYTYKDLHGCDTTEGSITRKGSSFQVRSTIGNLTGDCGDPSIRKRFYWYREQRINGNEVHLSMEKSRGVNTFWATIIAPDNKLHYKQRANFSFPIGKATDLADVLLMFQTFRWKPIK